MPEEKSKSVKRVRYRERQPLRANDLTDEQSYHIAMRRRHNIGHHRWGIVAGLELVVEGGIPFVKHGMAVDGYGRELIVSERTPLPMRVCEEQIDIFDALQSEAVDVWLVYGREPATPLQRGRWDCGPGKHSRWQEHTLLRLSVANTVDPRHPVEVPETDLDYGPHEVPPDNPEREWPVYLGRIRRTWLFNSDDLKHFNSLAVKLRNAVDPLSGYVRDNLSHDTQQLIRTYDGSETQGEELKGALIAELNQLLQGPSLYDQERFAHVKLRGETLKLIKRSPQGEDLICLNRLLVEDGYPCEFTVYGYSRPYATLIGEMITGEMTTVASNRIRLQVGSEMPGDRRRFAVSLSDEKESFTDRLTVDRDGNTTVNGDTNLDGDLIFGSLLLHLGDLEEPANLAIKLRYHQDPLSQYLREQFSDGTWQMLGQYDGSDRPSNELVCALIVELNQLLQGSSLYDEDRFAHVIFRQETRRLIEQASGGQDLVRLNRLLLEDGYPCEIVKTQARTELAWGVEFRPIAPPAEAAPWQIYHAVPLEDDTPIHQLRFEIGHPGDEGDPTRYQLIIGYPSEDGSTIKPCLSVEADCTVVAHDQLIVEGELIESPIPADPDDPRFPTELVDRWARGLKTALDVSYASLEVQLENLPDNAPPEETLSYQITILNTSRAQVTDIEVHEMLTLDGKRVRQWERPDPITLGPGETQSIGRSYTTGETGELSVGVVVLGVGPGGNIVQASASKDVHIYDV